jgi:hypothetical protein
VREVHETVVVVVVVRRAFRGVESGRERHGAARREKKKEKRRLVSSSPKHAPELVVQYSESYCDDGRSLGSMVVVVVGSVGVGGWKGLLSELQADFFFFFFL